MAVFTVHVPSHVADPLARADRTIFLRDGFSLPAFLFGPVVLLYRRLWLATLGWIIAVALCAMLARAVQLPPGTVATLLVLVALFTGLEANEFRRRAMRRRGYIPAAVLAGVSRDEGERLFFSAAANALPPGAAPARGQPAGEHPSAGFEPGVIGSFPGEDG